MTTFGVQSSQIMKWHNHNRWHHSLGWPVLQLRSNHSVQF